MDGETVDFADELGIGEEVKITEEAMSGRLDFLNL